MFSGFSSLKFKANELNIDSQMVQQVTNRNYVMTYKLGNIILGRDNYGSEFAIDMEKSKTILILGKRGSGKSFMLRSMWNRIKRAGAYICAIDIKPEWYSSREPLQKKWYKFLNRREQIVYSKHPEGFKVKSYRPKFLKNFSSLVYEDDIFCQMPFKMLTFGDFITLAGIDKPSITDNLVIHDIIEFLENAGEMINIDDIKNYIESMEDLNAGSKLKYIRLFEQLDKMGVIGSEFEFPDFSDDMNKGFVPVLNVSGMETSDEATRYTQAMIAVLLRKLFIEKKQGVIPKEGHLVVCLDEFQRYCPRKKRPSSREEIEKLYDLSRSEKTSIIACTQDKDRVPETILRQSDFKFFPFNYSPEEAIEILKEDNPSEYTNPLQFGVEVRQLLGSMSMNKKTGQREWLFVCKDTGENTIFVPYSPISAHKEENG